MKMFIVAALANCLLTYAPAYGAIANCGKNPLFTITELSQNPLTKVKGGENVSLTLLYSSFQPVEAGTVTTAVTYNFIPFQPTVADLCTSIVCPLAPGDHDGSSSVVTPTGLTGTVVSTVTWNDQNGRELLCIKSTLSVS